MPLRSRIALLAVCLTSACGIAATTKTMKAIVAHNYGKSDVLHLENVPVPTPKDDEMLIRVMASGVNPADPLIVSGEFAKEFGTHLPLIPGYEMAGVVEKNGIKISKFKPGDAVYAYLLWGGGWAEYCVSNERECARKPDSTSFVEAAAVPLAALTAWQSLVDAAQLKADQTVLIQGGSGGVGSFAIQIAKARGARVIATASTPNQDLLKELGADVAIDYTKTRFEDVAKDVDVVLDTVGGDTLDRSYAVVKKGGIVTTLLGPLDKKTADKLGIRVTGIFSHPDANELAEITKLIEAKKIRPIVSRVRPLTEAAAANEQAETHHTRGKVVIKIVDED
jgi:NADPH:quinone reductase-like Zn-dependent oxidoreductase